MTEKWQRRTLIYWTWPKAIEFDRNKGYYFDVFMSGVLTELCLYISNKNYEIGSVGGWLEQKAIFGWRWDL